MKVSVHTALLFMIFIVLTGCTDAPPASDNPSIRAITSNYPLLSGKPYTVEQVERIVDGDTFTTNSGNKVRLIGVNTPEIKGESRQLGLKASGYTSGKLTGKTIIMFADTGDTDKYGRLLRYVFVDGESTMFNELLLKDGFASVMTIPPNVTYADNFAALERTARAENAGLWGKTGLTIPDNSSWKSDSASAVPCRKPQIKGNIRGENKIYHIPGTQAYAQTKAERMFCTEDEAKAAGFRKALR
ncbi:thermonuclease family protein [Paenibacillus sp. sptzw28]|uniref:thermonuclease family protein n=1 Tax=Paenibacillus sp. sptzw28 TaxID=715179 RepID=UPI001C6E7DDE|nr:thermonuclease family protein [Paenibacillus sp. sptzw28]QYR23681.1 thermonuclease family protein [Paenibacillus sp. sptzw28]